MSGSITITLKLFAMLRDKLPPGTRAGTTEVELDVGATPQVVIERFGIPRQMAHLVMINGRHLLPAEHKTAELQAGDTLAIFPPIAGG
ncbi:MAG: MoaD/ThiS family protein [Myxococcales bacterium]|nr:MoaD/ThiS family protein [Myxococcales bacterium]